jgi:cell division protein FtsW
VEPGAPDYAYLLGLFLLFSLGVVMVYSTKAFAGGWAEMKKLGMFILLALVALFVSAFLSERFLRRVTPLALLVSGALLASLYVPGNPFALHLLGATRWLEIGPITFQPSELAKLAFILFAAGFLEKRGRRMKQKDWIAYLGVLGVLAALIVKQPDLGTTLCLLGIGGGMLVIAGAPWRVLTSLAVVGAIGILLMAWVTPHQRARLDSWLDPWAPEHIQKDGYQSVQAQVALARGGLTGVGLANSTQKLNDRLPEAESDFIFAIVGEELGLLRAIAVVLVYAFFIWRGCEISARAPDRYSGLIAGGVTAWIGVQTVLNLGVVTGTLPNTGVPLPFLSAGGTALIILMAAAGLVVGVSRRMRPVQNKEAIE